VNVSLQFGSDGDAAVRVEELWVRFRALQERKPTIKKSLAQVTQRRAPMMIDAIRGVSFEVQRGSVYGVIGHNGAGKSTLFRVIAGILPPTYGRVTLWGRVTPLLSLGVGFNRELTGRENILLGGLAAGLSREEVHAHWDEVEEFAGLGEAINFPMRTYSSGMFGRLAFSVAAFLDPEILLIDEALSAGDATFKRKSMEKIVELCERDCTVLIVSHGLEIVRMLADRTLWLQQGQTYMEGPSDEIVEAYMEEQGIEVEDTGTTAEAAALEDV
jgi:ABC-type polysaccharide/polyol phosphate transport system ATPase subunit